ncbi:MAG: hypothetical protein ACXVXN_09315 [Mycobacteriaceae bacterium]
MPTPPPQADPTAIKADVDAALRAAEDHDDASGQLIELEALHQRLASALATIDRV